MDLTRLILSFTGLHLLTETHSSTKVFCLNPCIPLNASRTPLRGFSAHRNGDFRQPAPGLRICERRRVTVTNDESPIIAAHTRKPIGIVPGQRMGLFRNYIICHCFDYTVKESPVWWICARLVCTRKGKNYLFRAIMYDNGEITRNNFRHAIFLSNTPRT